MGLALSETPKAGFIASSIWVCTVCICPQNDAVWVLYQEFKISILSLSLLSRGGFGVNSEICRLSNFLDSVDPDLVCIMRRPIGQSLHCS